MYYDNKFGFYIKQYGTQVLVSIICFIIILSGLLVYIKINNRQDNSIENATAEKNVEIYNETQEIEDDSILPEELRTLKPGEKISVKVATLESDGVLVILTSNSRVKAKLIGIDYTESTADVYSSIYSQLAGKYIDISFDELKVSNGYAMIYAYPEMDLLYNAKILELGLAKIDSNLSRKAINFDILAESQAYAKQTLAGIWGY